MVDTQTYTIDGPDGEETVELPTHIIDLMGRGEESGATIIGDIVIQAFAQQGHVLVHHAEGEASEEVLEANEKLEELFEERFGQSLADAMGHQH
jgi:hypothetical protein